MSNAIAWIVFASASLVLTATLAVASASATVPDLSERFQATVPHADLDLAGTAGRQTLDCHLRSAADRFCAQAGSPLQTMACRNTALIDVRAQIQLPGTVAVKW